VRSHVRRGCRTADPISVLLRPTPAAFNSTADTNYGVPVTGAITLVLLRLDYCNSILSGLPASLVQHFQSVQNAAAWLSFGIRCSQRTTDVLISLHWRVPELICYKLAVLTYRATNGTVSA